MCLVGCKLFCLTLFCHFESNDFGSGQDRITEEEDFLLLKTVCPPAVRKGGGEMLNPSENSDGSC
jgi:hypothetical protein